MALQHNIWQVGQSPRKILIQHHPHSPHAEKIRVRPAGGLKRTRTRGRVARGNLTPGLPRNGA